MDPGAGACLPITQPSDEKEKGSRESRECAGVEETQGRPGPSDTGRPMDDVWQHHSQSCPLAGGVDGRSAQYSAAWRFSGMQATSTGASYGVLRTRTCLVQIEGSMRGAGVTEIHRGRGTRSWPAPCALSPDNACAAVRYSDSAGRAASLTRQLDGSPRIKRPWVHPCRGKI